MPLSPPVEQHVALLGVGTLGSIFAGRLLDSGLSLDAPIGWWCDGARIRVKGLLSWDNGGI